MPIPTRELSVTYGGYTTSNLTDYYVVGHAADLSLLRFEFEISDPDATAFAAKCVAAEAAFRDVYQGCTVVCRGKTLESFSHSAGTGFNSKAEIVKQREGSSATSRFYTVEISFGRPADVHGTDYRRNSKVRVTWTNDRRMHVDVDGVYTVNGSTTARAQYIAAIGDYATSILTDLGGSYDLLEENVENDDQNKVATFHRKYDEQIEGRNSAEIIIKTLPNGRKQVIISGMYSTISAGTSSLAAYNSLFPAFRDTVLAAVGGTFEATTTHAEKNDTDKVTVFDNVYDELKDSRQEGNYQIVYATDRRITVIFNAVYYTGLSGTNAYTVALANFPTWATGILAAIGGTYNKRSESYMPNDLVPPNTCGARLEYLEAYTSQAGQLPHSSIRDQNYKVDRFEEAPGDYPGSGVKRMVELNVDYTAELDRTVTVGLAAVWVSIRAWLLTTVAAIYQSGLAVMVEENPTYNPDNNIISAKVKIWVSPAQLLLYSLEQTDSVDQGTVFDGLWSGDGLDFYIYPSHIVAIRKLAKTYRRIRGGSAPIPSLSTDLSDPQVPEVMSASTGEGGDDPFGLGGLHGEVINREQRKNVKEIGTSAGAKMTVEDVTIIFTIRVTNPPDEVTQ